jgi:hypothetical protein
MENKNDFESKRLTGDVLITVHCKFTSAKFVIFKNTFFRNTTINIYGGRNYLV